MFKVISGTLLANRNTIEFTDETISNNSIFEVYADQSDVIPVSVTVGGTTASITFDAKASVNTGIKVLVNNIEGEFAPDTIDAENVIYTTESIPSVENVKDGLDNIISGFEYLQSTVAEGFTDVYEKLADEETVLGGVLYHATTGNTWKKLDASNIDYDSGSTIYSAMGDIDELTTTASNIVGAINELNNKPSAGFDISTEETKTGKKLFGKDIYIRAYKFSSSIQTQGTNVGISTITNLNEMASIVSGYLVKKDGRAWSPLGVYMSGSNLSVRTLYNTSAADDIYLVFEYTKVGE